MQSAGGCGILWITPKRKEVPTMLFTIASVLLLGGAMYLNR